VIILISKAILIGLCGIFWRLGGAERWSKGWRRIGCAVLILIPQIISLNWKALTALPLLIGAFSLGYGENSFLMRVLKNKYLVRLVCGISYALASLPILWGNWWLTGFHIAVVSIGVMLAGNQRFQFEDLREEFFIGLVVGICPILA